MTAPKRTTHAIKPQKNYRLALFTALIIGIGAFVSYRVFQLTVIRHADYVQSAQSQYANPSALLSGRGAVYVSDLSMRAKKLAAYNQKSWYAYVERNKITQPLADIAARLAPALHINSSTIESLLSNTDKNYIVISRAMSQGDAENITKLQIAGVSAAAEIQRMYPFKSLAAHVLGFVGFSGNMRVGQYGVEAYYDDVLSGTESTQNISGNATYSGIKRFLSTLGLGNRDAAESPVSNPGAGEDVVLTIDYNIQSYVENTLTSLIHKWSAAGGSILVQDPATGALLAMASSPSFDPNNYGKYEAARYLNPAVQKVFEPGSSFKPITMAAALDVGAITPDTQYTDTGEVNIDSYAIHNFDNQAHGVQTMRQVLEKSLNTGAIFAEQQTGNDAFLNHVVSFGFGKKTGIDLVGELQGSLSGIYSGRKINFATASFGQGIAVTPLQLISAFSAIANNGKRMRPYIVQSIIHPDGSTTETKPQILDVSIKESTAQQLKSMLIDVVDIGFDKARVPGYDVAGKTGTAQIPDEKGGYLDNTQFIHDFAGFAPAYAPRFTVLIKLDKPKGIQFASNSLTPAFGDIVRFLIRYFNIPPTRK